MHIVRDFLFMKKIVAVLFSFVAMTVCGQQLYVGSYNIRYKNEHDSINGNVWKVRSKVMTDQIAFEQPDIFGTQEMLAGQISDFEKLLPEYSHIGVARDDGKSAGEHSAIFYREERVKLLRHGDFWLSETPEKPSLGWDAACVRICTWGEFKERKSGKRFFFFNLHMDHVGVVARREAAKLVVDRIEEMVDRKTPVILTGDFNVDQNDETYSIFTKSGLLCDAYVKAERRFAENGTFNEFNTELYTESRIDHIFVSPSFRVKNFGVLTNAYWTGCNTPSEEHKAFDAPQEISFRKYVRRTPSDHYPVFARIVR